MKSAPPTRSAEAIARTAVNAASRAGSGLGVASCRGPRGGAPLEKGAKPLLALVARPPLGDASRRLRAVGAFEHEPLRVPCGARPGGAELAQDLLQRGVEVVGDLVDEPDPRARSRRRSARR